MTDELNLSAWVARRAEQDTLQSHADYIVESIKELEDTIQEERLCKWELLESPWKERALTAEAKLSKSEALLARAVEVLEWQVDAIHNATTVNMKRNHRILLDGIYHEGPLVDWVHKILTGFETINRSTLAELKGETDE